MLPRIVLVRPMAEFAVALEFSDGTSGIVDLGPLILSRGGVFRQLHDPSYFAGVTLDGESGTLVWPNGLDIDPATLHALALAGGAQAADASDSR